MQVTTTLGIVLLLISLSYTFVVNQVSIVCPNYIFNHTLYITVSYITSKWQHPMSPHTALNENCYGVNTGTLTLVWL